MCTTYVCTYVCMYVCMYTYMYVFNVIRTHITRCYWDSQPCSVDDFVMLMTDYGKCYTFNADLERQRRVWRTG